MDGSKDLVHGPIMRRMLFFALPRAFASVLQQLCNTADVVVAGRLIGADAMAAIGSNIAASTVLANALGAALLLHAMARSRGPLAEGMRMRPRFDWCKLRAIVCIGLPAGVQDMVFSAPNIVLQSAVNSLWPAAMAGVAASFTSSSTPTAA